MVPPVPVVPPVPSADSYKSAPRCSAAILRNFTSHRTAVAVIPEVNNCKNVHLILAISPFGYNLPAATEGQKKHRLSNLCLDNSCSNKYFDTGKGLCDLGL